MLDVVTKRRIDTARDILVGKLPDPKSQVEQITIALIYKFMDDMDRQSLELDGKAKFFTGEYQKYAWSRIFDPKLSGYETVNVYGEAIQRMNQNPNIPQLSRDIFKNAYLPYRDPETLKSFLKVISDFEYDHSERLGDAFEYLLSVLGSQGEAGQFRTPRHIIDFMVAIVDPKKNDTILDPACGTAGFLISSYKHILKHNSGNFDPEEDPRAFELHGVKLEEITINSKKYAGDKLTSDDKERLVRNVVGYDISPDMVRLSLVNMYLHGFSNPRIFEYDTLTSEEKWNEYADVIMANPPFMSPKGGIRPHKRFSIESSRSEVLFVDYIAEHLNPQGRAAVIVPEGIIFQTQTTHKNLRKMLLEKNYLVGVISLPAGVFNPYSGVKTSILWMDRTLAKKTDKIIFVKVDNDGFDLGAQRRPIKQNDLPDTFRAIQAYKKSLEMSEDFDAGKWQNILIVERSKIAENDDYNLSGNRYRPTHTFANQKWPMVRVGEVLIGKPQYGSGAAKSAFDGKNRYIRITDIDDSGNLRNDDIVSPSNLEEDCLLKEQDFLVARSGSVGRTYLHKNTLYNCYFAGYLIRFSLDKKKILPEYLYYLTKGEHFSQFIAKFKKDVTLSNINAKEYSEFIFPLPPLEVQEQIVAEIEGYQKIITAAKQIVINWKPVIEIDPEWEKVKIGNIDVLQIVDGDRGLNYPKKEDFKSEGYCLFLNTSNVRKGVFDFSNCDFIDKQKDEILRKGKLDREDVVLTTRGTLGNSAYYSSNIRFDNIRINSGMVIFRSNVKRILPSYLLLFLNSKEFEDQVANFVSGSAQPQLPIRVLSEIQIPLPSLKIQRQIVERIESERALVEGNKKLIEIFEQKIKDRIAQVWVEK